MSEAPPTDYRMVTTASELSLVAVALEGTPTVGLDLETTGLDPRSDRVRLLSLATPTARFLVDVEKVSPAPLFPLLGNRLILGHNLIFDLQFLHPLGFHAGPTADTLLLSRMVHAGRRTYRHNLGEVALRELGITLPKEMQRSDWAGPLSDAQLLYAARDAAVLLPLYERLLDQVKDGGMEEVMKIEARTAPAVLWMNLAGVPFDPTAWAALTEAQLAQTEQEEAVLNAIAPASEGLDLGLTCNWRSPVQVKQAFARAGLQLESTGEDILSQTDHPLAQALRRYRSAQKLTTSYGAKWGKLGESGRIHPAWSQIGSDAGRMSCASPNVQQIPKDPRYRACVATGPGHTLIKADYSQIELRIAAKITGDERLLSAYRNGEDLHTLTARQVTGKQEITAADRQLAKALNFGLLYGMGAPRLRSHTRENYGIKLTAAEAARYRHGFFLAYPGIRQWHQEIGASREPLDTRTLAGRRRIGVELFTEKLNSPVQGTGADGLKRAMALLYERRDQCPQARLIIACHDELVIECPEAAAPEAAAWLRKAMLDGMAPLIHPVPVEVEAKIGRTWAG